VIFMNLPNHVQPHVLFGLDDQRSILNQLYKLAIQTARNRVELEQSWHFLLSKTLKLNLTHRSNKIENGDSCKYLKFLIS
jgi:hypothetical protein